MNRALIIFISFVCFLAACKKWEDKPGLDDDRLGSRYCNDPEAVNYNWGFPGTPDNSLCKYPNEFFEGNYFLRDTITSDTTVLRDSTSFMITSTSRSELVVKLGWCPDKPLKFTADRFFRATADSLWTEDSSFVYGQKLCGKDTLYGFISADRTDTTKIRINFTIVSDTGMSFHIGTAVKQP